MFFSASVFAIATITGVPGVIPGMGEGEHLAIADVFYSTPQGKHDPSALIQSSVELDS